MLLRSHRLDLVALLPVAALLMAVSVRLTDLHSLEPNVLASEARNLLTLYQLLNGRGADSAGFAPEGPPVSAVFPALPFIALLGPSHLSLRISSAVASVLGLVMFFLLARRSLGYVGSLSATLLLSFSGWYLFFSRTGEMHIWVLLDLLCAAYFTQSAVRSNRPRSWLLGGIFCGLGWYGEASGVLVLPSMLLYLLATGLTAPNQRGRMARGAVILTAMALVLLVPSFAIFGQHPMSLSGLALQQPQPFGSKLLASLRALLLMDSSLGEVRPYLPPAAALLDSVTATLYFVGLFVGLRHLRQTALWWAPLALTTLIWHPLGAQVPDPARALPSLPAMAFFAGLTVDRLIRAAPNRELASLAVTVGLATVSFFNWESYVEWQRSPANALARQPAIEPLELGLWWELQMEQIRAGHPMLSMDRWLEVRPAYVPDTAPVSAWLSGRTPTALDTQAVGGFATTGLAKPRGVASFEGMIVVLEGDGRLVKLDASGKPLASLGGTTGGPATEEVSDLAVDREGSLLVLDAGRARIDRYDGSSGRFVGTLGDDWGMYRPRGLGVAPDGRIYVADTGRSRIVVGSGDRVEREIRGVDQPTDVAVDERGLIYTAQPDTSRFSVLDGEGKPRASWPISRSNTVDGSHVTLLDAGAIAVTEPSMRRVLVFDPNGRELAKLGDENEASTFGLPYGIAASGSRLLIADSIRATVWAYEVTAR